MRARIASALFVSFAFIAALPFVVAAQTNPMISQPARQTPQKPPTDTKLLPPPPEAQIPLLANWAGSSKERAIPLPELKARIGALQNQKNGLSANTQWFGGGPATPNCAHIRIIQAPEMDSEMVVQMSPGDAGPIQTFQGLPPCRRDLPAPMEAQRFYGLPPTPPVPPRRRFVEPPALRLPSSQAGSLKP